MYLIPIGWLYVALMMSVAEATNSNGSVLGAIVTFVLYGLLPVGLVLYFIGTPGRKRALREREAEEQRQRAAAPHGDAAEPASGQPDAGGKAAADAVPPVGKEA